MADLQGYSYNRVLSGSPDWRHTISYTQTGRTGNSATYSVTIGLQLTEGSFGYGSYVQARVTVGGQPSTWRTFTSSNTWGSGNYRTVTISVTGDAGAGGGWLPAKVEWNCTAYATSPNFSVSGEFSVSTWNTAPYFTSGEQWLRIRDGNNLNSTLNGYIAENVSKLYLDWGYASDNEGGTITYILQQQVNNGGWTTIDTGTDRAHSFDIGSGNEGETRLFWVTARDNNGVDAASGVYSARITKNTLTAGWFTSSSNSIGYDTGSVTLNFTGGKNTSGAAVKYKVYSDTVQVYNQRDVTGGQETITIWRSGAYPSGPYIKFDELKNKMAGSNYNGNIHVGLVTKNDHGTAKYASGTVWVDLRVAPTRPTWISISGGSALKTLSNGQSYYIPNGSDTINFSWDGGGNPLGGSFTYRLYQIVNGQTSYLTEVSSSTKSYSVVIPKQVSKGTLAFGVHVYTNYGYDSFIDSGTVDIHYYNNPVLNVSSVTRTATTAKVDLSIQANTSIPGITPSGSWQCIGNPGESKTGSLTATQSLQSVNINPLFGEYAHTLKVTFNDNSGLSSASSIDVRIPANNSIMFVNKFGLGVGGAKAEENYPFVVSGVGAANSFANKGYETENTAGDKVGWWSRVASFKVTYQYGDAQAIIKYLDHGSGSGEAVRGELTVRVKQQAAMGEDPTCTLYNSSYTTLDISNFKLIEITNTGSLTDYELWVKVDRSYTTMHFAMTMYNGNVTMFKDQKLQQNPPSGRQIDCRKIVTDNANDVGAIARISKNGYWGMASDIGNDSDWVRTTVNGIIPHASNGNGVSSLGTSSWPFGDVYTKRIGNLYSINGLVLGSSGSKNRGTIPIIGSDGVMEVGKFIDMHETDGDSNDFGVRIEAKSGTFNVWGDTSANNVNARKYLIINDWYGGAETGRIWYKQDGKKMALENVNSFYCSGDIEMYGDSSFYFTGKDRRLMINGNGRLAIGNNGWTALTEMEASKFVIWSDENAKVNVEDVDFGEDTALDKISQIGVKSYNFKHEIEELENTPTVMPFMSFAALPPTVKPEMVDASTSTDDLPINKSIGLIAQEVYEVFPEIVVGTKIVDKEGEEQSSVAIDLYALTSIAIKGIQELNQKNAELTSTVKDLKTRIEQLEGGTKTS